MGRVQSLFRERLMHGLGQPKVDHLGNRFVVVRGHQYVRGFEVAVDDSFLMRVLDGLADLCEQLQSFGYAQPRGVAVFGDRYAFDVFHDEVGPAAVGQPSVEHFRDVGVVHHGQRLPLGLEAGQNGFRVHAGLDQLQRDLTADRRGLLGHPDGPHPPFADFFQQLIAAGDEHAGLLHRSSIDRGRQFGRG